ncbi:MAG TPA: MFS transporter [Patescibacteria group bacterium]|nr:MFS transporter [Patescibacteria group bacterium]
MSSDPVQHRLAVERRHILRFMTLSDVVILGASQFLAPIFPLFIVGRIEGGNEVTVGLAASCFLAVKSLLQIPFASLIDRISGRRDDFIFLWMGTFLGAFLPLFYLVVQTPLQLFAIQGLLGVGAALAYPSYMSIYTRCIDGQKVGTIWGVRFTLIDLAGAGAASLGGAIAFLFGFQDLILLFVGMNTVGFLLLFPLRRLVSV